MFRSASLFRTLLLGPVRPIRERFFQETLGTSLAEQLGSGGDDDVDAMHALSMAAFDAEPPPSAGRPLHSYHGADGGGVGDGDDGPQPLGVQPLQSAAQDFHKIASLYSPTLFAFGLFDSADITFKMTLAGLVDEPVAKTVPRWLISPVAVARDRNVLARKLGVEREKGLRDVLRRMLDDYDVVVSPLQRSLRKSRLPRELWTSFLRGTASVAVFIPESAALVPGVLRSCIDGDITDPVLQIDGDPRDRASTLAHLIIEASAEYGCPPLTTLALEIFARYHLTCSFPVMRRVQQSIVRTSKRAIDWQLRSSGDLRSVAPMWFREYFPLLMRPQRLGAGGAPAASPGSSAMSNAATSSDPSAIAVHQQRPSPALVPQAEATRPAALPAPADDSGVSFDLRALERQTLLDLAKGRHPGAGAAAMAPAKDAAHGAGSTPLDGMASHSAVAAFFAHQPTALKADLAHAICQDAAFNAELQTKAAGSLDNKNIARILLPMRAASSASTLLDPADGGPGDAFALEHPLSASPLKRSHARWLEREEQVATQLLRWRAKVPRRDASNAVLQTLQRRSRLVVAPGKKRRPHGKRQIKLTRIPVPRAMRLQGTVPLYRKR